MKTKLPKRLTESWGYLDAPEKAIQAWENGFRPIQADKLKRGMEIMFRHFLLHDSGGNLNVAEIEEVAVEEFTVILSSWAFGTEELERDQEVWVRGR